MDWGTVIQRRASKAPPGRAAGTCLSPPLAASTCRAPRAHLALRGNGAAGWFGWPSAPKLETLRDEWLAAADPAAQRRIAAEIQAQAFVDVPFLPLGLFVQPTVQRKELVGTLTGMSLFWNVRRA